VRLWQTEQCIVPHMFAYSTRSMCDMVAQHILCCALVLINSFLRIAAVSSWCMKQHVLSTLSGPTPNGAKAAALTERTRPYMEEVALNEQVCL
jgi:hypothetical protein